MGILKKYKKPVIIGSVIVLIFIFVYMAFLRSEDSGLQNRAYIVLSRTELVKSINVSGNIKSRDSQKVYSSLIYPVKELMVSEGDKVDKGDTLAKLDTANLELDIAQQRSSLSFSQQTAELDLQTKKMLYENNKSLFEAGAVSEQELIQSERSYKLAQANYDNDTQKIILQKLEKNLADSIIKAPIGGTVTAVYAEVGYPGNRLLFVIEDTENLVITTYLKEYDAGQVHPGQKVTIKSDATGDQVFNGEVLKIWPASTKNAAGDTVTSSTVEYETEVALLDYDPVLKIGMNTRLNIIIEKKENVYAVPYNAITVNEEGKDIIFIISEENGRQVVKELMVELGMESDFYTEISGDGVADGLIVLSDATGLKAGDIVSTGTSKE